MVGQRESAELLAKHGAEVQPHAAAAMGRVDEIKALLEKDDDATTRQFAGRPLLIWAVCGGQVEVAKLLLENGGDKWNVSPLRQVAQVKGEVGANIVDLLVEAGADYTKITRFHAD